MRIEPPVSGPIARSQTPATTSAADPREEPPDVREGSRGLRVSPTRGLAKPAANSRHCAVANTSAPASRRRATSVAAGAGGGSAGGGRRHAPPPPRRAARRPQGVGGPPKAVKPLVGGEQVQVLSAAGPRPVLDRG